MGGKFSITAFGKTFDCGFKGTNMSVNQKIEGFFQIAGIENATQIFKGDTNLQNYFD
jgi:hypothetical protein